MVGVPSPVVHQVISVHFVFLPPAPSEGQPCVPILQLRKVRFGELIACLSLQGP